MILKIPFEASAYEKTSRNYTDLRKKDVLLRFISTQRSDRGDAANLGSAYTKRTEIDTLRRLFILVILYLGEAMLFCQMD